MDAARGADTASDSRFINEQVLLDRASRRSRWQAGADWGRGLEVDPISGEFTTQSSVDGYWVVVMTI